MRDLQAGMLRQPEDFSLQKTQTGHSRTLFTFFKQKLQSQADAKKRSAPIRRLTDHLHKPHGMEPLHRVPEGSHPRQDHPVCGKDFFRVGSHNGFFSQIADRFFHAPDISGIIVNDCYHPCIPFSFLLYLVNAV